MAVKTLGELREISDAHPDAPKWWLGDWANEGTRRFGVTIEQAVEAGNAAGRTIRPHLYRGSLELPETTDDSLRWYYFRAAVGHFYEVAKHLDETENVPEVKTFVASLPQPAREAHDKVLALFRPHKALISNLRNSVFHYPSMMNPQQPGVLRASRPLPAVLRMAANHESHVRLGRLKDARMVFADELTVGLAVRTVGTVQNLEKLQATVRDGVQEFIRFMNPALDEHTFRRQRAGAAVTFER